MQQAGYIKNAGEKGCLLQCISRVLAHCGAGVRQGMSAAGES
jgi:hypothetical protein